MISHVEVMAGNMLPVQVDESVNHHSGVTLQIVDVAGAPVCTVQYVGTYGNREKQFSVP